MRINVSTAVNYIKEQLADDGMFSSFSKYWPLNDLKFTHFVQVNQPGCVTAMYNVRNDAKKLRFDIAVVDNDSSFDIVCRGIQSLQFAGSGNQMWANQLSKLLPRENANERFQLYGNCLGYFCAGRFSDHRFHDMAQLEHDVKIYIFDQLLLATLPLQNLPVQNDSVNLWPVVVDLNDV